MKDKVLVKETQIYKLSNLNNIVIREYINVGSSKFRRILSNDPILPEAINMQVEQLSDYTNNLEERFSKIVATKLKSYWANIITIFGIFIALLSFIFTTVNKIQILESWSFFDIFLYNTAQILPVAIILVGFSILLKLLFK